MAQVNIAHIAPISEQQAVDFARTVHTVVANVVYGLEDKIAPNSVTVLTSALQLSASISGAATELQVQISGNDWPMKDNGTRCTPKQAKEHFDDMARRIHAKLQLPTAGQGAVTDRSPYVWATPYSASGWAE